MRPRGESEGTDRLVYAKPLVLTLSNSLRRRGGFETGVSEHSRLCAESDTLGMWDRFPEQGIQNPFSNLLGVSMAAFGSHMDTAEASLLKVIMLSIHLSI